jgi:uridine phosphorylase
MKNLYTPDSPAVITPADFYGEKKHFCDTCMVILSHEIHDYLLGHYDCSRVAVMFGCNRNTPIYTFNHEGVTLAFYLSAIGSAIAGHQVIEANWLTGAESFIMFGSAGSLDAAATAGRYVIPSAAFRGEGMSNYYAEPADYISVTESDMTADVFRALGIPYVQAPVWTTDSFYRETVELVNLFRNDGCVAVEMETAGVQAVCSYHGFRLYVFLEPGDILDGDEYSAEGLPSANHDIRKLMIALYLAKKIAGIHVN